MAREGAIEQTWQSNREVRMENVGRSDVVDPWLSNGRNNFRNLDEIVASAVTPGMNDREKAMALWFQLIRRRFRRSGTGPEPGDPVKVFNVYGHNPCGSDASHTWVGCGGRRASRALPGPAGIARHRSSKSLTTAAGM